RVHSGTMARAVLHSAGVRKDHAETRVVSSDHHHAPRFGGWAGGVGSAGSLTALLPPLPGEAPRRRHPGSRRSSGLRRRPPHVPGGVAWTWHRIARDPGVCPTATRRTGAWRGDALFFAPCIAPTRTGTHAAEL